MSRKEVNEYSKVGAMEDGAAPPKRSASGMFTSKPEEKPPPPEESSGQVKAATVPKANQ